MTTQTRPDTIDAVETSERRRPEHRGHFATAAYARHRRRLDEARQAVSDSLHDKSRDIRRAAHRARWAAEDVREDLRGRARHAPLATAGIAFASGVAVALLTAAAVALAARRDGRS